MTILVSHPVRTPEDITALEAVPWDERLEGSSVHELLSAAAERYPDRPALTFLATGMPDETPLQLSYRQLLGRICQAANMFAALGVGPNDTVSMLLPNVPHAQFALWGAEAAGIANPINFLLGTDQIAELLIAARTKVLVALGPHPVLDIWPKIREIRDRVPELRAIVKVGPPAADDPAGTLIFDTMMKDQPADRVTRRRTYRRDDVAAYFHTGGTTGSPKLAQHTHGNQLYSAWTVAHMWNYTPESTVFNVLPLFHVAGSIVCSLAVWAAGSHQVMVTPGGLRNPVALKNHWKLVEKYKPTHVGGVPTNLVALLQTPVDADIGSIRYAITGGAVLPVGVERSWNERFGGTVAQMYGMTEAAAVVTMNLVEGAPRLGSVGIRMPYTQLKVATLGVDGEPTRACGANESGVVMLRGPNVFPGYKDPAQNVGTLTAEGWLITGDLGHLDRDGCLFLTGRSKDVIIRSGHNIDPSVIEEAALRHSSVALAAAVGRPDAYAGEIPVLYVQSRPGAAATPGEILRFLADHISERSALPKEVVVVDHIPMTAVGKIFKPSLRWAEAKKVLAETLAPMEAVVAGLSISVGEDRQRGMSASIKLTPRPQTDRAAVEREVRSRLEQYGSLAHEVEWV